MTATSAALPSSSSEMPRPTAICQLVIGGVVGRDPLDGGVPVLIGVLDLARLPIQIADFSDGWIVALDRHRVADPQRRCAARPGARAARCRRTGHDHQEIRSEARDLPGDGHVGALPDRDHRDERRDADEDAQHGERRAELVAADRLDCRAQDHEAEGRHRTAWLRRHGRRRLAWMKGRYRAAFACLVRVPRSIPRLALVTADRPVAERDHAVGVGGDVGFVGDHDDGHALLAVEADERLHDLVGRARVEIAGGFVGEQKDRGVDERPRDRDALLLPARQLGRRVALSVAEAQEPQRRSGPIEAL
jgi:hypothetical protein